MTPVDVMEELKAQAEASTEFSDATITHAPGPGFIIDVPREGRFLVVVTREEEDEH